MNEKNEPVAGATLQVSGTASGASTDIEGRYRLSLREDGRYELEVSAVGFNTKKISDVEVKKGIVNELDIVLEIKSKMQEAVIIRSTRRQESSVSLLNFQRNNTAVSSGLAADFIRRTPDRNTGEVLKRVSGASVQDNKYVIIRGLSDRYNQALVNDASMPSSEPDRKAFSFDMIPAAMIDNIIINKTATPDLPGEFAGGLVQINTRDIPARDFLTVSMAAGYNTRSTFRTFTSNPRNSGAWLGFHEGTRSLPSGLPTTSGYRSLTDAQKIEQTRLFNGEIYREEAVRALPITTFNIAWGRNSRLGNTGRFGTIIAAYHRQGMTIYDDVERGRFEQVRTPIFSGHETQNRFNINTGVLANFSYVRGRHKLSFRNIFNQVYEDNYYVRELSHTGRLQDVSLRSSFLNQRSLYSGQLEGEHGLSRSGVKLKWNGNFSHNYKSQPDFRTAQYVRSFSDPADPWEMDDDDTRRFFSTLRDYNAGFSGSLSVPFSAGGKMQMLRGGGGSTLRFRDFNARVFRYRPASSFTDITIPYNQAFISDNLHASGLFLEEQTQNTDKYFAVSALNSGYLMLDNRFGENFRLVWGMRAEFFEQFLSSRDLSLKRVVINTEKWDFLPSANLTYRINAMHQLRVSASQTVSRPEFREIAPFQFFDYEQIWGIGGNPGLKRTLISNADLRYEYYPASGEVLSLGLLAKHFRNPIELRMDPGSNSDRWLFNYTNAEKAVLYGAEVEMRKGLGFIHDQLRNFIFISNFTWLESRVTLATEQAGGEKSEADRPLSGQSPYLLNAGLQYTGERWNATVLYNRIGPRLALVGDPDGAGFYDIYERPRNMLDLQLSRKVLNARGEWKLTVSDLLSNRFAFYDNPSSGAGYRFSQGDRINYAYTPGTTISLAFTYDFLN